MREIKFRAWFESAMWEVIDWGFDCGKVTLFSNKEHAYESSPCGCCVIEQYTGLHDKNGREIYEGDVVKNRLGGIAEVIFSFGSYCVKVQDLEEFGTQYLKLSETCMVMKLSESSIDCEVIGNIHENPEMLE